MLEIQPRHINLETLLSNRLFRIPQYQRSYSWESEQRRDLFRDIRQSFDSDGTTDHFMSTIVALRRDSVKIIVTEYQKVDIVDGQQRITTLVVLLKAIAEALDQSDETQESVRRDIERKLVKADEASQLLLQTNHDTDDYFSKYIREGVHVPVTDAKTLAGKQLLMAIDECKIFVKNWQSDGYSLVDLVSHLLNRLTFILHEIADERLVYTVFEVLNSRGLEVSWFDRLKSMVMAIAFEGGSDNSREIIDNVHNLWADIYSIVGLHMGRSTESMRFAATLCNASEPSRPLGAEKAANLMREEAKGGLNKVMDVTQWLKSVTKAVDDLHGDHRLNAVTDIQQARLVATAVNLSQHISSADKERILNLWEKVTFRIYGMFRKDTRTAVGSYTRLAWRIVNEDLSTNRILKELTNIGRDYPINRAVAELQEANCYEGWGDELRYFFHRYEEHLAREAGQNFENKHWNHIWAVSATDSIEHIAPQSSEKNYVHWLGNLLLLPPPLNSKLGKMTPKQKSKAYRATGMRIAVEAADQTARGWSRKKARIRERGLLDWAKEEWAD